MKLMLPIALISYGVLNGVNAYAQLLTDLDQPIAKVSITGSNIKQIDTETGLPIQIIRRQELERAGITSTEQLLNSISANVAGAYNMSANQAEGFTSSTGTHNAGASAANLRGLGPESTLVLLNGRRIANHGLNGSSVDLNAIPFNAIERVEVLKDGASAIYGTDAIGGVINFILRSDYEGVELHTSADITQHGSGNSYSASLLIGQGSLAENDANFMASLAVDKSTLLMGNQRSFVNGNQPNRGLAPDTVGTPFATQVINNGFTLPGSSQQYDYANLYGLQGRCASYPKMVPYPTALWSNPYRSQACSYDYGADWTLMQPVEHINFVSHGTIQLDQATTLHMELTASHTKASDFYTPLQIYGAGFNYPAGGQYYQDLSNYIAGFDPTQPINIRWRCNVCGNREETTSSSTYRALIAFEGIAFGWNYKTGLSIAGSTVNTDLTNGFIITSAFKSALNTGKINPWLMPGQQESAAAMALIKGAEYTGPAYGGKSQLIQADASASKELIKLPAGWLSTAIGLDLRRESYQFNANNYAANNILFATSDPSLNRVTRDISAIYAELLIPIVTNLEADIALRHDHYSDFGDTTNPKVSLRYQPVKSLMLRSSWNKGFHAPDFEQMYAGQSPSTLNNAAADPLLCPKNVGNPTYCSQNWAFQSGGNSNLKPETSTQWSAGFVTSLAPLSALLFNKIPQLTLSVDYWQIERTNRIVNPDPTQVLDNYPAQVIRNPDGTINYIKADWLNIARDMTKGVDIGLNLQSQIGREHFLLSVDGSYLSKHDVQNAPNTPTINYVGQFGDPNNGFSDLYLRWRQTTNLTWKDDNWSNTISDQYSRGYLDQVPTGLIPAGFNPHVAGYNLVNWSLAYTGFKDINLTATIKNLFDTNPPFSAHNVDSVAGAGWDSRVGQARLRSFLVGFNYRFN